METILLDIIGIMLMRTWIMGTREITAPHSGGEYYSDNLIFISFFVRRQFWVFIYITVWNAEHCKS